MLGLDDLEVPETREAEEVTLGYLKGAIERDEVREDHDLQVERRKE